MITNSKPELCKVCEGARDKPKVSCFSANAKDRHWHDSPCDARCQPCTEIFHSHPEADPDKHKRVAERLLHAEYWPGVQGKDQIDQFERILREEYPE